MVGGVDSGDGVEERGVAVDRLEMWPAFFLDSDGVDVVVVAARNLEVVDVFVLGVTHGDAEGGSPRKLIQHDRVFHLVPVCGDINHFAHLDRVAHRVHEPEDDIHPVVERTVNLRTR